MTDENDVETLLDEHGIVTEDDLQNAIDDALGNIDTPDIDLPDDMPDEFDSFVDERGAAEVADQRVVEHFDHLVNEDCDTDRCNSIRDQLGIEFEDVDADADDGEADEADAEDAETTETGEGGAHRGGESSEADDDDEGNSDGDSEASEDITDSGEGSTDESSDDDGSDDVETNVFGEPV